MSDCAFESVKGGVKCLRCNKFVPKTTTNARATCTIPAFGDKVAGFLKAIGIRKRPGCGCGKRQKKLNDIDTAIRRAIKHAFGNHS